MGVLPTPLGRTVRVVEQGSGPSVVFLHSGVGSPSEWRAVFSRWPGEHRLIAIDAYGTDDNPAALGSPGLDDYVDQVRAVTDHVGEPIHLVGFSWGGATALRTATTVPSILTSLTVIEPQAYSLLPSEHPDVFQAMTALRDRWREHVAAGDWHDAFTLFLDHYNGAGSFDDWPADRREAFLAMQQERGDLWDVLFEAGVTPEALETVRVPALVVEGGSTAPIEQALCAVCRRHLPRARHVLIEGAGHMMPLTHSAALTGAIADHVT